jgi:hydrogenase nickel incorporation protein HypB
MEPIVLEATPEDDSGQNWAARLKETLDRHNILAMHVTGGDGCGKTTLMIETLKDLGKSFRAGVVCADCGIALDARRYCEAGIRAVNLSLGEGQRMNSAMVVSALERLEPAELDLFIVEHTGNLMLATRSDLGIKRVITCLSVTQGWGPIEKFKPAFSMSAINIITKSDLAQVSHFNIPRAVSRLRRLNLSAPVIVTSAETGDGVDSFRACIQQVRNELACSA